MTERDVVARILAVGAVAIGGFLAVNEVLRQREINGIQAELDRQRKVDCFQTGFTGEAFQLPPLNLNECRKLEDAMVPEMERPVPFAPKVTPTPVVGG